jgi:hypothetical protein
LIAAFVFGDLAGRAWPISTSVTVMGERHSGDARRRQSPMMTQKDDLATLRDRLARMERGEVWGGDHPEPYTAEEKAAEIARIMSQIASLDRLNRISS